MIRILHIYPELLNLYGEYANLSILTRYLIEEGMEVEVTPLAFGEPLPTGYDMFYLGCGTESASLRALNALRPYLSSGRIDKLEKAMRAAKLANAASSALRSGGLSFLTGR